MMSLLLVEKDWFWLLFDEEIIEPICRLTNRAYLHGFVIFLVTSFA